MSREHISKCRECINMFGFSYSNCCKKCIVRGGKIDLFEAAITFNNIINMNYNVDDRPAMLQCSGGSFNVIDYYSKYMQPAKIIFNDPCTICYFVDGTKVISRAGKDERYEPEHGVMACIVKKLYGSRQAFIKAVAKGKNQREDK